jgi:hypothetical protein
MKANKTTRGKAVSNHRRRKEQKSENNTDSAAHNQTLKKNTAKWQESPHTYQY